MGLGNTVDNEEEETQEESSSGKVSYIYVRSEENKDAYDLMSTSLGGDAEVREAIKSLPDDIAEDQHDFFQQFIEHLQPVFEDDDYSDLLEFLMVDDKNIAQFLDQHDDVREEFMKRVKSTEEGQTGDSEETAAAGDD